MPKAGKSQTPVHSFFTLQRQITGAFQDISSDFIPDFVQNLIFKHALIRFKTENIHEDEDHVDASQRLAADPSKQLEIS